MMIATLYNLFNLIGLYGTWILVQVLKALGTMA